MLKLGRIKQVQDVGPAGVKRVPGEGLMQRRVRPVLLRAGAAGQEQEEGPKPPMGVKWVARVQARPWGGVAAAVEPRPDEVMNWKRTESVRPVRV